MTTLILTNHKTGETLESPFASHEEAVEAIRAKNLAWDSFPEKMVSHFEKWGAKCSDNVLYWLHKTAMPTTPPKAEKGVDMSGLHDLFATAKENGLKYPKIRITAPTGESLKISVAGTRSKYHGDVMVAAPTFGAGWFGRVTPEGDFFPGKDATPEIKSFLGKLASDPAGVAKSNGELCGACCFCNKELTTDESTTMGYGPHCAKTWNLPWGKKAAREKVAA